MAQKGFYPLQHFGSISGRICSKGFFCTLNFLFGEGGTFHLAGGKERRLVGEVSGTFHIALAVGYDGVRLRRLAARFVAEHRTELDRMLGGSYELRLDLAAVTGVRVEILEGVL